MDINHTGEIDYSEFLAATLSSQVSAHSMLVGRVAGRQCLLTFSCLLPYYLTLLPSQRTMDAPSVGVAFGLLDKDGDGYLTKADLMHTLATPSGGYTEDEVDDLLLSARAGTTRRSQVSSK